MTYRRVCNFCGVVAPEPAPDGWLAFRVEGCWMDSCPACSIIKGRP